MNQEERLLKQARHFNKAALAEIYDLYSSDLYRYAMRLLGNADQAEECVAETVSRFLHAVHRGRGPNKHLRAYLYRIAHNWITDTYRRQPPPPLPLTPELQADPQGNPEQAAETNIEQERIRSALRLLTPNQRQVIVLKYLEGWKHKEIAHAMEKPVGAVKALQHRGVTALQRLLIDQETEP